MTTGERRGARWAGLLFGATVLAVSSTSAAVLAAGASTTQQSSVVRASRNWASFGNGPEHDFTTGTSINSHNVGTLHEAWFFPTGDAVTATPTMVGGVAYFGSWDTKFYAVNAATGKLRWSYQLDSQTGIRPYPGENPRPDDSDGGLVTSSAWYEPADSSHPNLVIFGGGYTLYALDADAGTLFWKHVYDGMPEKPPSPTTDQTRIFSSPIVEDGNVYVGVDNDGEANERGYIVAASLLTGDPVWIHQTDVGTTRKVLDNGCGNVWSSGSYLPGFDDVVFTVADCDGTNSVTSTAERLLSLDAKSGKLRWSANVVGTDRGCDFDEVGTNVGLAADGTPDFLGAYGKDGTYVSLNPATGAVLWSTRVVFGGADGGFIGSPAFTGTTIYGATAIGDETGGAVCMPQDPDDTPFQDPSFYAIDAATGRVLWDVNDAQSFGATTYAGGFTFNCQVFSASAQVREADTGALVTTLSLPNWCWSGIAVSGHMVVMGVGNSASGTPGGVIAFKPTRAG